MTWALLTRRPTVQAHLLVGALQAEGVAARVEPNGLGSVYGQNTFAARIYVQAEELERARAVLAELDQPEPL